MKLIQFLKVRGGILSAMTAISLILCNIPAQAATPEAYQKQWRDPALLKRVTDNIEKYRKGDLVLELADSAGKPLVGAEVTVHQTGHEFLFGCNAFVLGQMKEMEPRYEEAFLRLFNFATVPFYWEGTEPKPGELRYVEPASDMWRRPPPDRFIPFAAKHGITLKGHPLLWHAYNPNWLPKDANELRALYQKRFREISSRFGDKIPIWDVVNESLVCRTNYPLYTPDHAYVGWAFKEAVPLFPAGNTMMINEVTSFNFISADKNPYLSQIKNLLADGAQIRGIGLQYHYFRRAALDKFLVSANCNPAKMLDLYEALADFQLPLFITEITIPSAGSEGEALQAQVVSDHYRLWFSAPTMAGITWWNLGDGTAVKGENEAMGGLMDGELKPKAAYQALDHLINEEWKTQAKAQTDAQGTTRIRGFYGKYQVSVTSGNVTRQFEIQHSGKHQQPHRLTIAKP
ncbi:MAG: endo-1,4-beta-xylanase [Verrucomicrobiota bacterium]